MPELELIDRLDIIIPERYRKEYNGIDELASSIASEEGLITPLAFRKKPHGYELAAGGRRLKALDQLRWSKIPAHVYPEETSDLTIRTVELMENVQREDLTFSERARLTREIHRLYTEKHGVAYAGSGKDQGHSLQDTAELLGVAIGTVSNDIKLADIIDEVPEIAEMKNRSEALKMISKVEEQAVVEEIARRTEEKRKAGGLDNVRKNLLDSYVVGDFFEGIQKQEAGQFNLVEIDPPYGINYTKDRKTDGAKTTTKDYNEVDAEHYEDFMLGTFQQCYRVMAPNSWLLCWFSFDPWYSTIQDLLADAGFTVQPRPALWIKPTGICPAPSKQLQSDVESFFYARKGDPGIYKEGHKSYWSYPSPTESQRIHPTERPVEMMKDILSTFIPPGSHILTPFAGSGNTILAAHALNMTCLGYDLSKEYKSSYTMRVAGLNL